MAPKRVPFLKLEESALDAGEKRATEFISVLLTGYSTCSVFLKVKKHERPSRTRAEKTTDSSFLWISRGANPH